MILEISVDKVAEVIILAREMPRGEPEFDAFVDRLNEEEQASLVAIFWVGRGSFDASDVQDAYRSALREATTPTADYLKGSPHLADHLETGLEELGESASEAEDDLYRAG